MNTKKLLGAVLMGIGTAMVCGALALLVYNRQQDARAGQAAETALPQLAEQLSAAQPASEAVYDNEMSVALIDGYEYIGIISIPTLELELPVLADWDDARMKTAPCRYSGSVRGNDLVICGHNYTRHFGNLKKLSTGDSVYLSDMDGETVEYQVMGVEVLEPTAIAQMTESGYDLTLFTCTYSGTARVTVRCSRAQ